MHLDERDPAHQVRMLQLQVTAVAAAFLGLLIVQTVTLMSDRMALAAAFTAQETPLQQSLKARQQLEAVAAGIVKLADEGDANARTIVEDLRRQGVTLRNPQAPAPQ